MRKNELTAFEQSIRSFTRVQRIGRRLARISAGSLAERVRLTDTLNDAKRNMFPDRTARDNVSQASSENTGFISYADDPPKAAAARGLFRRLGSESDSPNYRKQVSIIRLDDGVAAHLTAPYTESLPEDQPPKSQD